MLSLSNACILYALTFTTLATPHHPPPLQPRTDPPAIPPTPGIEATITSPTGTDLTSNFQILLYESPPQPQSPPSNLTDRQVAPMRPLNFCWSSRQTFSHSHCNYHYRNAGRSPLQQYIIYCSDNNNNNNNENINNSNHPHTHPRLTSQPGACRPDEICVDDGASGARGGRSSISNSNGNNQGIVAKCVARSYFKPIMREHTAEEERAFMVKLRKMTASVTTILTQADGRTPLRAGRLEVDAGVVEEEGEEEEGGVGVQSNQTCTDCFMLASEGLPAGTDFLRTQATLSAAGAVTAGVMFLAVLSG